MPSRVGDRLRAVAGVPQAVPHRRLVGRIQQPKEDLVLRPKLDWRAALTGGALCLAYALRGGRAFRRVC